MSVENRIAAFVKAIPLPVRIILTPVFMVVGIVLILGAGILFILGKIYFFFLGIFLEIQGRFMVWQSSRKMKNSLQEVWKEIQSMLDRIKIENPEAYEKLVKSQEQEK